MALWEIKNVALRGVTGTVPDHAVKTADFDIFTKIGEESHDAREAWKVARGFAEASDSQQTSSFGIDSNILQIIGWVVAVIIVVLTAFGGCE